MSSLRDITYKIKLHNTIDFLTIIILYIVYKNPNIGEVWWHRKKMKLEKSSLTKKKLLDFLCKKPKNKFYSLDLLGFTNINIYFLRFF